MTKVLVVGAECSRNKGSAAMLISTIRTLKKFIPESNFTIFSTTQKRDLKNCAAYNLKVVGYKNNVLKSIFHVFRSMAWNALYRLLHIDLYWLVDEELLREYADSDIIIDLGGDTFTDDYGIISSLTSCYRILICKFLNKPMVIYAQSIGPFETKLTKSLSKFCLNSVNLLIVREEITRNYLQKIGITNIIHSTADSAFLLEPPAYERIQEILLTENIDINNRPIIEISASQHIYDYFELDLKEFKPSSENSYVVLMAKMVDYLVDELTAQIIFVPHVTNDDHSVDDRFVAKKIYHVAKTKDKIRLVDNEYSPRELKGIIAQSDLFIGARMHATIAATSMCVPTITIAYSHKAQGIIGEMLGQEKYVLDIKDLSYELLISKIDDAWENRDRIKEELKEKIPSIKEKSMLNGKLVKELLDTLGDS